MREPAIPKTGEEIKASTIADIIRWVKSIIPRGDGKTIRIKTSQGGSIISSYSEESASAVILKLGTVKEFNPKLTRCVYNATSYISFDDKEGKKCYAIAVSTEAEDESNILPENSLFLGFSNSYKLNDPEHAGKKLSTPVYLFDYPRWIMEKEQ